MTEKDKLTLRKPLAPKGDDAECKAAYKELAGREAAKMV